MGGSSEKVLLFFKLHPTVITEDNLHQSILVSSMLDSPINSLYQAVRQVFAPVLLKVIISHLSLNHLFSEFDLRILNLREAFNKVFCLTEIGKENKSE